MGTHTFRSWGDWCIAAEYLAGDLSQRPAAADSDEHGRCVVTVADDLDVRVAALVADLSPAIAARNAPPADPNATLAAMASEIDTLKAALASLVKAAQG